MRSIVLGNVSPSYGMVAHHVGTIFWRKKLGSVAFIFLFSCGLPVSNIWLFQCLFFDTLTCSDISIKYGSQDGCLVASVHIKFIGDDVGWIFKCRSNHLSVENSRIKLRSYKNLRTKFDFSPKSISC
jgi:hypothetical protein